MAAEIGRLTARQVETLTEIGRHADGGGLYLAIGKEGRRRWIFIYRFGSKRHELGLGSPAGADPVTLKAARQKAAQMRAVLAEGRNPLKVRDEAVKAARAMPTFAEFADEYVATHASKFKNDKHVAQWRMTLGDTYCRAIRSKPLDAVDTETVLAVLRPVWTRVPETASRLRGRIEAVLDAARAMGFHPGPNPAAWRGHLKTLLPTRQKLTRGHHAALPYDTMPAFLASLRAREAVAARALEVCILTACRSGEVLGMRWEEIDMDKAVWTVPANRMKAGIPHRVPLSDRVQEVLRAMPKVDGNPHVFPGQRQAKPLSGMSMEMMLRRMGRDDITVHGMRSAFRDWAAEKTSFPASTAEHALAHRITDKAESAHRRGDELERRRELMQAWVRWCEPIPTQSV